MPKPMPVPPPVTMATWPSSSPGRKTEEVAVLRASPLTAARASMRPRSASDRRALRDGIALCRLERFRLRQRLEGHELELADANEAVSVVRRRAMDVQPRDVVGRAVACVVRPIVPRIAPGQQAHQPIS